MLPGLQFFEKVVRLQQLYANGKQIENVLQTNGTLLDDRWREFLARNRFLVGISIDGPAELHDAYRTDKLGKPTFARVMRAIGSLKRHKVEFNTLTTVNRKNSYAPLSAYRFLKEIGIRFIQFLCPAYKFFFTHIDKYMKFMAQKLRENRAPANVMKWVRNNF
jgi:uncharacterized protein